MLDSNTDRSTFLIGAVMVGAVLIFGLIIFGSEAFDSMEPLNSIEPMTENGNENIATESTNTQKEVSPEKPITISKTAINVLLTIIAVPLLTIASIFGFKVIRLVHRTIKRKNTVRRKEKEFVKRDGYTAYKNLIATRKHIRSHYTRPNRKTFRIFDVDMKLKEIQQMYNSDRDSFDILMYKHEQGFIGMDLTLRNAFKEKVADSPVIIDALAEMVEYPHNDIVGEGLAKKIVEPLEKEIRIQKDLNQMYDNN